jgi:ribosomal protein S17
MEIKKKTWPEYFEKILNGEKKFELRLADFDIHEGDTLILEEYNPKTKKYTGRTIRKKAKQIIKINPTKMYNINDIIKFGFYAITLE